MKLEFEGRMWEWNPEDQKLLQVNDWIKDLDVALKYVKQYRGAIQAGGAMGIWPVVMSEHFEEVYTYEPNRENFRCLCENVREHSKGTIIVANAGLGKSFGYCTTKLAPGEINNAGAYYTVEGTKNDIPQWPLDGIDGITHPIDLIQLDVEGREFEVLQGARNLITEHKPVIMIEDKVLPQDAEIGHVVGAAEKFLVNHFGYKVVERVHRDIVLVHQEKL